MATPTPTALVPLTKQDLAKPATSGTLLQCLEQYKPQFAMALPRHMTAERMIRVALTAFNTTPALQGCSLLSIMASVVQASILGLEPNSVLGEAYLIPFKGQCVLVPGWKGLLKLVRNSGQLLTVNAQPVHEKDTFSFEDGLEPTLIHKRATGDRGKVVAYWAGALLTGGGKQFVFMTVEEATAHGKKYSKSFSSKSSGWQTDFDAMALKTCIRKLCKYLPQSVESQIAIALAESAEREVTQRFSVEVPIDFHPVVEQEAEVAEIAAPQAVTETGAATSPAGGTDAPAGPGALITGVQAKRLTEIAAESGWSERSLADWLLKDYHAADVSQVPAAKYDEIIGIVRAAA